MDNKTGTIYCGNARDVLMHQIASESVDLIYMDPPFFSNKNYEIVFGNGYELKAYEDRWKGGIENYIAWMEPILRQCHRVLKATGSFYLHCDQRAHAHLRILLDGIFGTNHFQNEIIWRYGLGGSSPKRWRAKHDNIFYYSKGNDWTFNQQQVPATSNMMKGQMKGMDDVWEIPSINNMAKERLGYPTQKPEALLDLIIKASSNPNDIVLDPMSGGGTTVAVAYRLERRWIAVDVSPIGCQMIQRRLISLGASPRLEGMPMSVKALKALEPFTFQNWVVDKLYGHPSPRKVGDMGVDGFLLDGRPLQVKQSDGVGRPVVDSFETALTRLKKKEGMIVGFSFSKGAFEEVARAKNAEGMNIELKTVKAILEDMGAHDDELEALEWQEKQDATVQE